MTVKITQPARNLREELNELRTPTGIAGEAMMRADTPQEQFNLIGAGRKNLIINGGFDVWQRGTSSTTDYSYLADRWLHVNSTSTSRQTDAPSDFAYSVEVGHTIATYPLVRQRIEAVNCKHLAGKQLTVSFWAKNVSGTAHTFVELQRANAPDNYSGVTGIVTHNFGIGSSEWTYYTHTFDALPSEAATNGFQMNIGLQAQAAGTIRITGVQLELGKVATPFEHRSYGEELALCQRYYEQIDAEVLYPFISPATGISTIYAMAPVYYAKKRVIPSISASGDFVLYDGADKTVSAVDLQHTNTTRTSFRATSSGIVAGRSYKLQFHIAGDRCIKIDAEL